MLYSTRQFNYNQLKAYAVFEKGFTRHTVDFFISGSEGVEVTLKQSLDDFGSRPMNRKEFLAAASAAALSVVGVGVVIKTLEGTVNPSISAPTEPDLSKAMHLSGNETVAGTKTFLASPVVPTPTFGSHATNKTYVDKAVASGMTDATATTPGSVQLAGDLGGTADAPTVPGLNTKQPLNGELSDIAGLTPSDNDFIQRKDGTWINRTPAQVKTDLVLAKGDVALGNVDNTSDANKPVSIAFQAALDARTLSDVATTVRPVVHSS